MKCSIPMCLISDKSGTDANLDRCNECVDATGRECDTLSSSIANRTRNIVAFNWVHKGSVNSAITR